VVRRPDGSSLTGEALEVRPGLLRVDAVRVPLPEPVRLGILVGRVVELLGDIEVSATIEPGRDLRVRFGEGMVVRIGEEVGLTVVGAARGPASSLRISRPLELQFGGRGVQLSHERFRTLSRLARVQVVRARLHPDGEVRLEGRGAWGFDLAVRGGLQQASKRLSDHVRTSPRFRRVREFLRRP